MKKLICLALIAIMLMMTVSGCWVGKSRLNEHNTEIAKEAIKLADSFLRTGGRDWLRERIDELIEQVEEDENDNFYHRRLISCMRGIKIGSYDDDDKVLNERNSIAEMAAEPKRKK